jgi:carboxyl-terminal processing protease
MSEPRRLFGGVGLPLAIFLVGVVLVLATRGRSSSDPDGRIVGDALELVRDKYVTDVDGRKLAYRGIEGMMRSLDPYSEFLGPDEKTAFREETEGEFTGIGIVIDTTQSGPGVVVLYALSGSPADRVGMRTGDRILETDSKAIDPIHTNHDLEEVKARLRGKIGTSVTLAVQSPGEDATRTVKIVREHIRENSVRGPGFVDGERAVGYVHVRGFNENTARDFEKAARWLVDHGMKALVLDLRYNPGGLLKAATDLADELLEDGVIVTTKGRDPASRIEYEATGSPKIPPSIPVVVLVNGESASAAEVVAGALQDHRRALLVGSKTFGKGVVQTTVPFDGDRALIKITTARYYTPAGRCIEKEVGVDADHAGVGGILPDVEVATTRDQARAVATRIGRLRALEDQPGNGAPEDRDSVESDPVLVKALALLRGEPAIQPLAQATAEASDPAAPDDGSDEDGR